MFSTLVASLVLRPLGEGIDSLWVWVSKSCPGTYSAVNVERKESLVTMAN